MIDNHYINREDINGIKDGISDAEQVMNAIISEEGENRDRINRLIQEIERIAKSVNIDVDLPDPLDEIEEFNLETDLIVEQIRPELNNLPRLSTSDYIISCVSGAVAIVVDVLLIGTPEVVKIWDHGYKGEQFDGSVITEILRKIDPKNDDLIGNTLKWFSDKCKLPYDISTKKDVVYPENHRLRSLAHDPFLGLFFAIADIMMGTTTCIDNNGCLRIIPNNEAGFVEKLLPVLFYVGHIISDMFTARGIPIPGFFLTQFFTNGEKDQSIADIAFSMYRDGYDLRHLISMSSSVAIKDLIIEVYFRLTREKTKDTDSIARKEITESDNRLRKEKMLFVSDLVGTTGNIVKFIAPPVCCNPNALNVAQWFTLIRRGLYLALNHKNDQATKEVFYNREIINEKWNELLRVTGTD